MRLLPNLRRCGCSTCAKRRAAKANPPPPPLRQPQVCCNGNCNQGRTCPLRRPVA